MNGHHHLHRRYHSPDRRPVIETPIELEYECSCGATFSMGKGRYHTLDGKRPIAFTTNDWNGKTESADESK